MPTILNLRGWKGRMIVNETEMKRPEGGGDLLTRHRSKEVKLTPCRVGGWGGGGEEEFI